jgi:hypothetical protein
MINLIFEGGKRLDNSRIFLTYSRPIVVGIEGYKDFTSAVKMTDVEGNDFLVIIFNAAADDLHCVGSKGKIDFRILLIYMEA